MIGYNFNQKHLPLDFAGTCLHCGNEGKVRYSIPADIGIILRTGKANYSACNRCWDNERKEFKLGYQMGPSDNQDFKARFDAWFDERIRAGDIPEDDIVLE